MEEKITPVISVVMPTYNQASFICRAIESLKLQTFGEWELIIINDGSSDNTADVTQKYLEDSRIHYYENFSNKGLGVCLNKGLRYAKGQYIAYLPSDDIYYKDHLETLLATLKNGKNATACFSGVRYRYNKKALGKIEGFSLQLVQVLHKNLPLKWKGREEIVTDSLDIMYWNSLRSSGEFIGTNIISCEWVDHPNQRHKIIQEPLGGINPYKLYYKVREPLRFQSTVGNNIDEFQYYSRFKNYNIKENNKPLKIVLVGELAYNAERIIALEEEGHQLYGLWMKNPYWYNYIGPFAFGHVKDIPYENWAERIKEIQPDVIYGLLNWQAVPFAHEILTKNTGIPFVWHFKEGPFICLEKGTWNQLIDLYTKSDGQIYTSPEMLEWFKQYIPAGEETTLVLDGDLPKKEWFTDDVSPLLSSEDGHIHTVVPGRPIGLHPHTVAELAKYKIHLHFYGDFTHGQWKEWINKTLTMAPDFLHIHSNVTQENWVKEFSQYDAGWLHFFKSENEGEWMKANWDDLNYPARMATLAAAGLPMLQFDNSGHIVATQSLVKKMNLGIFFSDMEDLYNQLQDKQKVHKIRDNVWSQRNYFSFDYHVKELTDFFEKIINIRKRSMATSSVSPLSFNPNGRNKVAASMDKS